MFDALINGFDFNPFEPGNPMTLGLAEELGHKRYVNCRTQNFWEDDYSYDNLTGEDDIDDDDNDDEWYNF